MNRSAITGQRLVASSCWAAFCSTIPSCPSSTSPGRFLDGSPLLYIYIFGARGPPDRADGVRYRTAEGLAGCCRAGSSSPSRSPTWACCSRSPTTATSAPTPAARSSPIRRVYALSLAVYCTAWTFYGSVGRAAASGIGFLPIYLGPTLMAALWWFVLRKIIRISKANRITSIADFVASRYGKSQLLGGLVTVIAVVGVVPYIALQLKAVSNSFTHPAALPGHRHADGAAGTLPLLGRTPRSTSRCCWPPSRSCSARATSTRPSATRAWSRRSPSNRWSSWSAFLAVGRLRHLRHVRRLRRHLQPRRGGARARARC